jgi:bidirectional [NiFe] hydrogenase diaphorase subunit
MKTVSLTIDGKKITSDEGNRLLWVALDNDIYIPNLCGLKDDSVPSAACRLCFVEVEGKDHPVTACTEKVTEGMVVNTSGKKALRLARSGFELIIASHPVAWAQCTANRACELQKIARHLKMKLKTKRLKKLMQELPVDDSSDMLIHDPNLCVLCGRCVRICGELGFANRGFKRVVTTFQGEPLGNLNCQECSECVSICPTGALAFKDSKY